MNGFTLLLYVQRIMDSDTNPLTDYSLASVEPTQDEINAAFKTNPWCRRLKLVNRKPLSRDEWKKDVQERKAENETKK